MYKNLEAEMARQSITKKDIADCLNLGYGTVILKFQGKYRFYFDEALKIKDRYFPDFSLEYLFLRVECKDQLVNKGILK